MKQVLTPLPRIVAALADKLPSVVRHRMPDLIRRCVQLLLPVIFLAGCSSLRQADNTQFYVLSAATVPSSKAPASQFSGLVFVAPAELASYLENPGIANRRGQNRIEYATRHQWAQPLADDITQVLREDLAQRLGNAHVNVSPTRRPAGKFISVQVRVDQFELVEMNQALLQATWRLSDGDSGRTIKVETSRVILPVQAGERYAEGVITLRRTVAELARQIANALQE